MIFKKCVHKINPTHSVEYAPLEADLKKNPELSKYVKPYQVHIDKPADMLLISHPVTQQPRYSIPIAEAKNYNLVVNHTLESAFPAEKDKFKDYYNDGEAVPPLEPKKAKKSKKVEAVKNPEPVKEEVSKKSKDESPEKDEKPKKKRRGRPKKKK